MGISGVRAGNTRRSGLTTLLALGLPLAVILLSGSITPAGAACQGKNFSITIPAPAKSQLHTLHAPLLEAWQRLNGTTFQENSSPGRGGSYAIGNLLLGPDKECALAAIQVPGLFFLSHVDRKIFSEKDIAPVVFFAYLPHALWVDKDSPYQSMDDLVFLARGTEDKPGIGQLSIAGTGSFTDQHMANLVLSRQSGVPIRYLPYTSSSEASDSVKSKRAQACWGYAMPPESMPGMRPIAITAQHRSLALPLTPTFAETGMNIITGSYLGLTMASSVPEPVRASVAAQTAAALSDEKLRYSLATSGATLVLLDYDKIDAFMDCRRREAGQFMEDYPLLPAGTR